MFEKLSAKDLIKAAQIKARIESLESELEQMLGRSTPVTSKPGRNPDKGGMSEEGRARIIAAQKARWAKFRSGKLSNGTSTSEAKPKRKMSAAAKAKIAAAAKRRWAKAKASGKNTL